MGSYFPKNSFTKRFASKRASQIDQLPGEGVIPAHINGPEGPESYNPEDREEILYIALKHISTGAEDAVSIATKALADFENFGAEHPDQEDDEYEFDPIHGKSANE